MLHKYFRKMVIIYGHVLHPSSYSAVYMQLVKTSMHVVNMVSWEAERR